MNTIRHYLRVYWQFVATSIAQTMSFRIHFLLVILVDLFFYASSLASVDFIFRHVESIGVWNREEFLFFICFMLAVDHLHMIFFSHGFWMFSADLRSGNLDFHLLKPTGALFNVFFRHVRIASLVNAIFPWGCLIYFGQVAGLSLLSWLMLPLFVLLALTLIVSIEIVLSMAMFWTIEAWGINLIRIQLQSLARWPDFVYIYSFQKFFTFFVPVLLVGSAPVKVLLEPHYFQPLLIMIVAILLCWWVINMVWKMGLRKYESASS